MTNTVTVSESGVQGDLKYIHATVNVTSLANAGNEPFDPVSQFDEMSAVYGVSVTGVENGDSYVVTFDHLANQFTVVDFTGANVAGATDIGEVRIKVEGE